MTTCELCYSPAKNLCGRCKAVSYCSTECQKNDWPIHKKTCNKVQAVPAPLPPTARTSPPDDMEGLPERCYNSKGIPCPPNGPNRPHPPPFQPRMTPDFYTRPDFGQIQGKISRDDFLEMKLTWMHCLHYFVYGAITHPIVENLYDILPHYTFLLWKYTCASLTPKGKKQLAELLTPADKDVRGREEMIAKPEIMKKEKIGLMTIAAAMSDLCKRAKSDHLIDEPLRRRWHQLDAWWASSPLAEEVLSRPRGEPGRAGSSKPLHLTNGARHSKTNLLESTLTNAEHLIFHMLEVLALEVAARGATPGQGGKGKPFTTGSVPILVVPQYTTLLWRATVNALTPAGKEVAKSYFTDPKDRSAAQLDHLVDDPMSVEDEHAELAHLWRIVERIPDLVDEQMKERWARAKEWWTEPFSKDGVPLLRAPVDAKKLDSKLLRLSGPLNPRSGQLQQSLTPAQHLELHTLQLECRRLTKEGPPSDPNAETLADLLPRYVYLLWLCTINSLTKVGQHYLGAGYRPPGYPSAAMWPGWVDIVANPEKVEGKRGFLETFHKTADHEPELLDEGLLKKWKEVGPMWEKVPKEEPKSGKAKK